MNRSQETQTKEIMQVKFHYWLRNFRSSLSLPEYKAMHDICMGILKSNSVVVNKIAQSLHESVESQMLV